MLKFLGCVISSIDSSSFARICFSVVSLSLILAKRLIASLKHKKRILEIWLQLIFSNLKVHFSAIWGGRKTKDLVVHVNVNVNWYPLTSVWDQSSPKLTSTLFTGLPYARNRSLDWDLFCGGSSARLLSTSHWHKMDYRPGIIIYATSQYVYIQTHEKTLPGRLGLYNTPTAPLQMDKKNNECPDMTLNSLTVRFQ